MTYLLWAALLSLTSFTYAQKIPQLPPLAQVFYPEGPLLNGKYLYYVEYSTSLVKRISLTSSKIEKVIHIPDCGPASLGKSGETKGLIVSCYDSQTLVSISTGPSPKVLSTFQNDQIFYPNDFSTYQGKVFFTNSGPFDLAQMNQGFISMMDSNHQFKKFKTIFNYPNGISIYNDELLLVSEHFSNRVTLFNYKLDKIIGSIDLPRENEYEYLGPDGLKINFKRKSFFVAQFGGGQILEYSLDQMINKKSSSEFNHIRPKNVYKTHLQFPTNFQFAKNNLSLFITAVGEDVEPYRGQIIRVRIK